MTVYEFNQSSYAGLPTMDEQALKQSIYYILDFLNSHQSNYYLMLNNDLHYYTVFHYYNGNWPMQMAKEIMIIAKELGEIKSIEVDGAGEALEFWIVGEDKNTANMYVLFDYSRGVVEV